MSRRATHRRLARDERGNTLVEFAFVLPVLAVTLMGFFDLGYRSYVFSIVEGALHEASRMATVGNKTGAEIDAFVASRLSEFSRDATIAVAKKSYAEFSDVKLPEKITGDTAPTGQYNPGDCYEDANNNGKYDTDRGAAGLGGSEDVIHYEVTMTYPRLFPMAGLLGWSNTETIKAATVLRNQPYAARTNNMVIRCA